MIILLIFIVTLIVVGIGLLAALLRRDEPVLGMAGLVVLLVAGMLASVYGVLASI